MDLDRPLRRNAFNAKTVVVGRLLIEIKTRYNLAARHSIYARVWNYGKIVVGGFGWLVGLPRAEAVVYIGGAR